MLGVTSCHNSGLMRERGSVENLKGGIVAIGNENLLAVRRDASEPRAASGTCMPYDLAAAAVNRNESGRA